MKTAFRTTVVGHGNHASIEIPDENLEELGANRRAPLKITINGYTYQSTATGVGGRCMVVFPQRDRKSSGVESGDTIIVNLELDSGYRQVIIPPELKKALKLRQLDKAFKDLSYSRRKECVRQVSDAKTVPTKLRRIDKILNELAK